MPKSIYTYIYIYIYIYTWDHYLKKDALNQTTKAQPVANKENKVNWKHFISLLFGLPSWFFKESVRYLKNQLDVFS